MDQQIQLTALLPRLSQQSLFEINVKYPTILVMGGAGFIGSHLVDRLMGEGFGVTVLDNFRTGKLDNVNHHMKSERFELIAGDIRDEMVVKKAVGRADTVIHLAALISTKDSVESPFETYDVNLAGTLNLLEAAARKGIERFVYASSMAVYGEDNPLPLREGYPLKPISPYAASKVSAECFCMAFRKSYGLNSMILRYSNVYGPRQMGSPYSGVVAKFVKDSLDNKPLIIYGDGHQTRDFIYVDDDVEATMLALKTDATDDVFNICTGKPTTIKTHDSDIYS